MHSKMMYSRILQTMNVLLLLGTAVGSFPENNHAISVTDVRDVRNSVFTGGDGDSQLLRYVQDIKMVKIAGKEYFAVTGREKLFLIEPKQLTQAMQPKIPYSEVYTWKTDEKVKDLCVMKGRSEENCGNYIRVVEQMDDNGDKLLICGTNSYEPKCKYLSASMSKGRLMLNESTELISGTDKCPFGPDQTGASLYTRNSLYSATASDFNGRSHSITRSLGSDKELRTPKLDDRFLNKPRFVKMVDDAERVLVFMNELVKSDNGDVRMVAYVAQVCKNDAGGRHVLVRQWTKFEKTRLNCSWNGFYFDQLQDVSEPVSVKTSPHSDSVTETIYATFTTPEHSVPGSAVCAFTLNSIHDALLGKFREVRGSTVETSSMPTGLMHPGNCPNKQYSDKQLEFMKSHPLLEDQAKGDLLTTYVGERWTAVAVDTEAGPDRNWTMYFVGTEHGQVLRYLSPTSGLKSAVLLKRQNIYDSSGCQNATTEVDTAVSRIVVDEERNHLLVAFKYCVISTPLRSCAVHKCKSSCLESADPYCGWNGTNCIDHLQPSEHVEQHVFSKASNPTRNVDDLCLGEGVASTKKDPVNPDLSSEPNNKDGADTINKKKDDGAKNGSFVIDNVENGNDKSSKDGSISAVKIGGMSIQIAIAIGLGLCLFGFLVGLCVSKLCCKIGTKSTDIEKQQEAMNQSKMSLTNNKDSLCKKIISSISPKRKRRGSTKPPSLSQSQSTIAADNQQGEPLFSKEHSKLEGFVQHHDTTDRYVNMTTLPHSESKHSKPRLNSTGSGSQITVTESVSSYTSRRRASAQPALSVAGMGKKAVPNLYSTAPRIRHHSGNRTSDPSEYMNPPTLRTDKPVGRMTSRHSTPVPVTGYPATPNSLKDYQFTFPYDQVVQSTEHVLNDVKEVIEQQQRRSAEMETLVEESHDDVARLRHQSSDSGKGSSPRNSLQTEEQDTVSTLSRNKPDNLVLGPPPITRGRKRLNSEPTSPTGSQPPLPPASVHNQVGRSTSMRSQYSNVSAPAYPSSRGRSGSFSSHHSHQGIGPVTPMKMHQMPKNAFIPPGQPNLYATLPINAQMVAASNPVPQPDKFNRQMSYDTYSPMRYPSFIDHSDHPAMNLPDRFSSLPSRSQAHRSNKQAPYPAQPYPSAQVQMRRSSAAAHVPPYLKQMSTPAKFEQHSGRMSRGKYAATPSVPGIPSPLPEQNAV